MDSYDVIIVGTGAGGAPLARELARDGKRVLVLEKGVHPQMAGSPPLAADVVLSREGVPILRAVTAGGTTEISAGNMVPCLVNELCALGIDLSRELAALEEEVGAAPLDASLRHEACRAIAAAGGALDLAFVPMGKCINVSRCDGCGMCLKGCATGARWSARETLDDAVAYGATVMYGTECTKALHDGVRVTGVAAVSGGAPVEYHAPCVVVCAGGLATPVILQASGIEAGMRLSVDLLAHVYGFVRTATFSRELPMPLVCIDHLEKRGFILSPNVNYGAVSKHIRETCMYGFGPHNALGLMIKIRDSDEGRVYADGTVSKAVTAHDKAIFDDAKAVARDILVTAGADPGSLFETPINGAHPLGTAAIGTVVSTSLETRIAGLYVCDASVLPTAPGFPPIMTIMALALRLARHLTPRFPESPQSSAAE